MRLARLAMLITLSAPICASAYELVIDDRVYSITASSEHTLGSSVRRIILGDAELAQCRRYRDAGAPSAGGQFAVIYGSTLQQLFTNSPVEIQIAPFRYSITTVDGDIVCLPYQASPIFGDGVE